MTFHSELSKQLYYNLPAEKQVLYTRMEEMLADAGNHLHLLAVATDGSRLEIHVSISEQPHGLTR